MGSGLSHLCFGIRAVSAALVERQNLWICPALPQNNCSALGAGAPRCNPSRVWLHPFAKGFDPPAQRGWKQLQGHRGSLSWHCTNPMCRHRFPVFPAGAGTAQAGAVVPQPPGLGRGLRCPVKPGGEPCNAPAGGAALCSPTLTSQRRIPAGLRRGRGREEQAAPRGARSLGPCRGLAGVLQPGAVILGMLPLFWGCPRSSLAGLTRPRWAGGDEAQPEPRGTERAGGHRGGIGFTPTPKLLQRGPSAAAEDRKSVV